MSKFNSVVFGAVFAAMATGAVASDDDANMSREQLFVMGFNSADKLVAQTSCEDAPQFYADVSRIQQFAEAVQSDAVKSDVARVLASVVSQAADLATNVETKLRNKCSAVPVQKL